MCYVGLIVLHRQPQRGGIAGTDKGTEASFLSTCSLMAVMFSVGRMLICGKVGLNRKRNDSERRKR